MLAGVLARVAALGLAATLLGSAALVRAAGQWRLETDERLRAGSTVVETARGPIE